ncbi:MAG TPA: L,D-transpeptidase [Conexibacter sp.]|jgi:lipoprotein-anchoring transpeptidase ErfK/SrfK|nr:L,D-transpeptidase [Conexibacter sp.]
MSRTIAHAVPRRSGARRSVAALAVGLLSVTAAGSVLVAPARAAGSRVPANQSLVVLLHDHVVQIRPSTHARRIESVGALRPLTGARTVLPVLGRATSRGGKHWVHVRLPGRPNGHAGWIAASQTRRASTEWRLSIKLSARLLVVFHHGRVERRFPAVVGKPSTPTPSGHFFVEESLALSSQVGGPYALATSARSDVLQEFEGGPGQIAIHGTNYLSGALGTAASHGCIRLSTSAITWLAHRIGSGVSLTIVR